MESCEHLEQERPAVDASGDGCVECLRDGTSWVALRRCLDCGHVGCCDSSIGKHATAHHQETQHPVMQAHGGGDWRWCYLDEITG
ncbi:MAG: UBP-type zinc finger domain-containing protein [Candidatus Dormibacteria bacterium]